MKKYLNGYFTMFKDGKATIYQDNKSKICFVSNDETYVQTVSIDENENGFVKMVNITALEGFNLSDYEILARVEINTDNIEKENRFIQEVESLDPSLINVKIVRKDSA